MRKLLFLSAFVFFACLRSISQSCKPNVNVEAMLLPYDSAFKRDPGVCYSGAYLRSKDTRLEIVSYTIQFSGIPGQDEDVEVIIYGMELNPKAKNMLTRMVAGSAIGFYCIKAKNQNGQVLTLQPVVYRVATTGVITRTAE